MALETWITNAQTAISEGRLCTAAEFHSLAARQNGFEAGTVISAKEVNAALRQANMVAVALCYAVGAGHSFSIESNSGQLRTYFEHYFEAVVENVSYNASTRKLTVKFKDGRVKDINLGDFPSQVESAVKDGNGNVIVETYATKVELANYATVGQLSDYVTQSIANATYATKEELDDYLTEADAALTYATKTELNEQKSWCDEYDSGDPTLNALMADSWSDYSPGASGNIENIIVANSHDFSADDNVIISIDKSATKAQCEAFYDALLVPVGIDTELGALIVKALGDVPSIDIPVTVMRV